MLDVGARFYSSMPCSLTPGSGFPDHPHRGQATVTYMIEGVFFYSFILEGGAISEQV
jgi:redox-sensitive bicupin YhaK (pirin superfamily)